MLRPKITECMPFADMIGIALTGAADGDAEGLSLGDADGDALGL